MNGIKIKKAKTDSLPIPNHEQKLKDRPEAENLLGIYSSISNQALDETLNESGGKNFSDLKKEILSDERKKVYYVYKNVYTPVKCGILMCKLGDGILEKTFFKYDEARTFIKGDETIKVEPKNTVTIENNGQTNEVETVDIDKLQHFIKAFESGKITDEDFNNKNSEIIK